MYSLIKGCSEHWARSANSVHELDPWSMNGVINCDQEAQGIIEHQVPLTCKKSIPNHQLNEKIWFVSKNFIFWSVWNNSDALFRKFKKIFKSSIYINNSKFRINIQCLNQINHQLFAPNERLFERSASWITAAPTSLQFALMRFSFWHKCVLQIC